MLLIFLDLVADVSLDSYSRIPKVFLVLLTPTRPRQSLSNCSEDVKQSNLFLEVSYNTCTHNRHKETKIPSTAILALCVCFFVVERASTILFFAGFISIATFAQGKRMKNRKKIADTVHAS